MTETDWDRLLEFDRDHVWHPYAPSPSASASLPVVGASGVRLELADGRQLVDGMASWWTAVHGYRHPVIDAAVREQLGRLPHVMFGGLTHAPAIQLAERLVSMAPVGLEHVFLADSGSVSVEVALKVCLQYQRNSGHPERCKFLALEGGYHGDTFGAMAVCDPVGGMHRLWTGVLPSHVFAPRPPARSEDRSKWAAAIHDLASRHLGELAAIVAEPVVQGAGGMWFYDPACVLTLREVCDRHGLLLVLDEIATGFGRTGTLFAASSAGVSPDVMCVGKALTGGYMSLAAMLCTGKVARVASGGEAGCLMHGPTYMANPLACAAGLASTGLLLSGRWEHDVRRIERGLVESLGPALHIPGVKDVRVLGAIGVVQLDHPVDVATATSEAVNRGVWLRPFRDLIYTMPPYITTDKDVATIGDAVVAAAAAG
jgi:adenosylmethionine-8-amino-7-oxononanoate aminotransferase